MKWTRAEDVAGNQNMQKQFIPDEDIDVWRQVVSRDVEEIDEIVSSGDQRGVDEEQEHPPEFEPEPQPQPEPKPVEAIDAVDIGDFDAAESVPAEKTRLAEEAFADERAKEKTGEKALSPVSTSRRKRSGKQRRIGQQVTGLSHHNFFPFLILFLFFNLFYLLTLGRNDYMVRNSHIILRRGVP